MTPKEWKSLKGSEIAIKITKGSSPKWQGFDYQSYGCLFVTSENVRDGYLDISSPKFLPEGFNLKQKNSQLNSGDVLINIVGASIGRSCLYKSDYKMANINQAVCLFRPKKDFNTRYLGYFLQAPSTIIKLLGTQTESARPNLSLADIKSFIFVIPPRNEQNKIATILSTWDEAIEKFEKLIEAKKLRKKGLMQQLLTGKKRFDGFDGEWEDKTLGDMGELVRGLTYSPDDVRENGLLVLRSSNVQKSRLTLGDNVYVEKELDDKYYSKSGDILICVRNGSRNLIGKNAIINDECPKATHGAFMSIYRSEFFSYIFQLLQTGFYYKQVHRNLGATINSINNSDLRKFKFNIPPLDEQKAISSFFEVADKEVELLIKRKNKLSYEKKGLMQQLLTGKKRVKID